MFVFTPLADTYVDSSNPTLSNGKSSTLTVDRIPQKSSFMKFRVEGIDGRTISAVRLRLWQKDSSRTGGRVYQISSADWGESITWDTRPAIDGPLLGTFPAVSPNGWYELDLGPFIDGDGVYAIAIDSASSDSSKWSSRTTMKPPQLIVEVEGVPGFVADGLSQLADSVTGSSNPTAYANGHRLVVTEGGRLLAIHGRHGQGVRLAWREPGGGWLSSSRGGVDDGVLLSGTGTGDWAASLALARDPNGDEIAYAVWSGVGFSTPRPLQIRRISELDSPLGPQIGPVRTLATPPLGAAFPDLAFDAAAGRMVVAYLVKSSANYEVVAGWLSDLSDAPTLTEKSVVTSGSSSSRAPTIEATDAGLRLLVRGSSVGLCMFAHDSGAPLDEWTQRACAPYMGGAKHPAATVLASGDVLATFETSSAEVAVVRYESDGTSAAIEFRITGYKMPTIASDGARAWMVAVRSSDGVVVSRELSNAHWSSSDRVEIGIEGGGGYRWPNALRHCDGRLRFTTKGPSSSSSSRVLAFQRSM